MNETEALYAPFGRLVAALHAVAAWGPEAFEDLD